MGFCHGAGASYQSAEREPQGERAALAELGAARRALSAVLLRSGVLRSSLHPAPSSPYLSRRPQAGPRLLLPPFPSSRLLLSPTFPLPSRFLSSLEIDGAGVLESRKQQVVGITRLDSFLLTVPWSRETQSPFTWFDLQMEGKAGGGGGTTLVVIMVAYCLSRQSSICLDNIRLPGISLI